MIRLIKFMLVAAVICLGISVASFSFAQDDTNANTAATTADEQISAEALDTTTPSLLPDSPFYFLKEWTRKIRSALTFNETKKADLENKFANEKLLELRKMAENGVNSDKIQKATENYQKAIERVKNAADKIKDKAENNPEVNKFLEKFTNQQVLHEKILEKLETQVPEQALEKIKEAREQHLEKFQQVMTKLEENSEKIAEKIKNALQNGDANNPEILDKIKDKMPEEVKQKIEEIRTNVTNKVIEKAEQKNEKNNCPLASMPSPDFCKTGKIKVEKDDKGCITGFKCVMPNAEPTVKNCKELWWFDNEHRTCQQKNFCGAYIYQGLRTFEIKEACLEFLNVLMGKSCSNDADCGTSAPPNYYYRCVNNKCVIGIPM